MKEIAAMMAGVIVEVLVKPGDSVKDGMQVAVLESMKMQLPVNASSSGKVKEVRVKAGQFVNEGDPLLLLE